MFDSRQELEMTTTRWLRCAVPWVTVCCALAASAPAQTLPQASVHFPEGQRVVTVPFERYHKFVVIPVSFDGIRPLRMVLDTGSPVIVIADTELADQMDLQIWAHTTVDGTGDGPTRTAPLAGGVSAKVGALRITGAVMLIGVGGTAIGGLDGIIGGPLFENLVVDIDWQAELLHLHDPAEYAGQAKGTVLPLTLRPNRHIYTTGFVDVSGKEPVPVTLHVDTGARQALGLFTDSHEDLQVPAAAISNVIVGWGSRGAARGDIGRTERLVLSDHVLRKVVTSFRRKAPDKDVHGWIGLEVLERFRVVFDYPSQRMILAPNARLAEPFTFHTTGLFFAPPKPGLTALTVVEVMAGSPAAQAGIAEGDRLTHINDKAVAGLSSEALATFLKDPDTRLTVTFERQGEVHEKTLKVVSML